MPEQDVNNLQFQRAEPVSESVALASCKVCKQGIAGEYFHAAGHMVCRACAERLRQSQQTPPAVSLAKAGLFGLGAMIAGSLIYTAVMLFLHIQIGIVAIVVGIMVGKAIRMATRGVGGRPQQIMAVLFTYFAISTSYLTVGIVEYAQNHKPKQVQTSTDQTAPAKTPSVVVGIVVLLALSAAAPVLALGSISGWISAFILFIGLRSAWRLTARANIPITGPYQTAPAAATA